MAALASLLIAFSPDSLTNSTWIANPVIAYCLIPIFYFSIWKTFFERRYRWLVFATFILGLLQQSLIFLGYFWIVILVGYFYDWQQQKKNRVPLQLIIISIATYLLTISTMILTQLKLIANGIYPMLGSVRSDLVEKSTFGTIQGILTLYFEKMRWIVVPQFPVFSVFILILAVYITWKNVDSARRYFIATWLFAPLIFLLFLFRDAIHTILGIEWILVFCLAFAVVKISQKIGLKYILVFFLLLIFVGQIFTIKTMRKNEESFVGTQQGAWVDQQLALIDKTYALAAGQPFSISTYTNPYGYNTTWAYLYSWYGKKKYGYMPAFYGPDQTGLFGEGLLQPAKSPLATHFVIVEPIVGVPEIIYDIFMGEQNAKSATPSATIKFGSIVLQQRVGKNPF